MIACILHLDDSLLQCRIHQIRASLNLPLGQTLPLAFWPAKTFLVSFETTLQFHLREALAHAQLGNEIVCTAMSLIYAFL
jgi:hypothetical protein